MAEPLCTVLLATYDRCETLLRCLEHLAASDVEARNLQVIVVDDGSTDGAAEAATDAFAGIFGELVVRRQANAGPAAARNAGIADAAAPITLFINDDTLLATGAVAAHLATHVAHPNSMVLGTFDFVPEFASTPLGAMLTQTPHLFPHPLFEDGDELVADLAATCNISVPTEAAQAVSFDPRFTFAAEDVDFGLRLQEAGYVLRHCAAASAHHDHHLTVAGLQRTAKLRGFGAARLALKHGQEKRLVERAKSAAVDRQALEALLEEASRSLQSELDAASGISGGDPTSGMSQSAYVWLADIFKVGNLLGYLDEPTVRSMTERSPSQA